MTDPTLFDLGPARARARRTDAESKRDEALARVEANADEEWLDYAKARLLEYLQCHETMFTDDFVESIEWKPRELRALGPVFLHAARQKWMRKSGRFRKSIRSNMTEKPVWDSLVSGGC